MNKLIERHLTAFPPCLSLSAFKVPKWYCSAQIGSTAHLENVNDRLFWQPTLNRTVIGASVVCNALYFFAARLNAAAGQLLGSDGENMATTRRKLRAFSFQTLFVQTPLPTERAALRAVNSGMYGNNPELFSAHLLLGFGVSRIMPKVNVNKSNSVLELVDWVPNAVYNRRQAVIPFGFVVKWPLNESTVLRFESPMRKLLAAYTGGLSKLVASNNAAAAYLMGPVVCAQTLS
jgi:hypothetical protein